jgi:hypothetical protein
LDKEECKVLSGVIREIIDSDKDSWWSLKYETQYGLEFSDFP